MQQTCDDLLAEYRSLDTLCASLTPAQWRQPTHFHRWSAWDEIAHLCWFDQAALQAAIDADAFVADARALAIELARGAQISAVARQAFADLDGPALLALWRDRYEQLVAKLARFDLKARLPWYGPTMSARSFATARLMEAWAHGQDIWDALGRQRPSSHRLRHIAHIGVTTFGWTFVNRKLPVPEPIPYVELQAPDSSLWTWGAPSVNDFVHGPALDFCLLVTQRRHRDDTALQWAGAAAESWTAMAQCFAGPPAIGPGPGERLRPP